MATKDRQYALKLTQRRVQNTIHRLNPNLPRSVYILQIEVLDMIKEVQSSKTAEIKLSGVISITGGLP
jgi:hypothetical protein